MKVNVRRQAPDSESNLAADYEKIGAGIELQDFKISEESENYSDIDRGEMKKNHMNLKMKTQFSETFYYFLPIFLGFC